MSSAVRGFMDGVIAKNPAEKEFHQAVEEVVESLVPVMDRHPEFRTAKILERMVAEIEVMQRAAAGAGDHVPRPLDE